MNTYTVDTGGAYIVYDVAGDRFVANDRPPLVMIDQPMDAGGFRTLASYFPERVVVTYDPRGLGRSVRKDGDEINSPVIQAEDAHTIITALGPGRVDLFASNGCAVTAFALVAAYPHDVATLVAHEPPLPSILPDGAAAERALAAVREAYHSRGSGAGMAAFIAMISWRGESTDEYFARTAPNPAVFGMSPDDDGSRDDPVLSERWRATTDYQIDCAALTGSSTRILIGVGEESEGIFTGRTSVAWRVCLGRRLWFFRGITEDSRRKTLNTMANPRHSPAGCVGFSTVSREQQYSGHRVCLRAFPLRAGTAVQASTEIRGGDC